MRYLLALSLLFPLVGDALADDGGAVVRPPAPDKRAIPETEGFMNDYHKKNAGKIVFSTSTIERKKAPASSVTSWNANDRIWLRVYLADSPENLQVSTGKKCRDEGSYNRMIDAYVKGKEYSLYYDHIARNLSARDTTFSIQEGESDRLVPLVDPAPFPKDTDLDHNLRYTYLNQIIPALTDGDNVVRFVAKFRCDMDNETTFAAADATVHIRITPAIRAEMAKGNKSVFAKSVLPPSMDKYMKAAVTPYFNRKYTVAAVSATGKWRIEYHPINGRPTSRKIDGQAFLRGFDGKSCGWLNVTYEQRNVGGNRYDDSMEAYVEAGEPKAIQCAALPK